MSLFASSLSPRYLTDEAFCLNADADGVTRPLPACALPKQRLASRHALAGIACVPRERVERPAEVGVGLAGLIDADSGTARYELFGWTERRPESANSGHSPVTKLTTISVDDVGTPFGIEQLNTEVQYWMGTSCRRVRVKPSFDW